MDPPVYCMALVASLGIAGCMKAAPMPGPLDREGQAGEAHAVLVDPDGRSLARATFVQAGDRLRVRVEAAGLAPGAYGAHLHSIGRCDPPGFASAGPHWNPDGRQHGKENPEGMHRGDLPNLLVGADGRGSFEIGIAGARLSGSGERTLIDADGAAVVIHALPDDYRTDPSGNSGTRIACGILV